RARREAPAPAADEADDVLTAPVPGVVVALRPQTALTLAGALALAAPLSRLAEWHVARTILVLDHGACGRLDGDSVPGPWLERLALLGPAEGDRIAVATEVPSMARLSALVAASLPAESASGRLKPSEWFREILFATGLVASGATLAVMEVEAAAADPEALRRTDL